MEAAYIACVDAFTRQHVNAPKIFAEMFREVEYNRVIELGTGTGAFTYFLGSYQSGQVYTFDTTRPEHEDRLRRIQVRFKHMDVFAHEDIVANLITCPGRTLLLCDGGDKAREVNIFAKYLKVDDVIMAHDYAGTPAAFEANGYWRSLEVVYEDVRATCERENLQPFWPKRMLQIGWLGRIKAKPHGDGIHL